MQHKLFFLLLAAAFGPPMTGCSAPLERVESSRPLMGTNFRIIVYAPDARTGMAACDAAFARLEAIENTLSDYRAESEISRLSRTSGSGQDVAVGPELWHMLTVSRRWSQETAGAFDITVGPMVRLWRQARHSRQMPRSSQRDEARAATGYEKMILNDSARTCRLAAPGMRLDVGAIAKGYAADEAIDLLKAHGLDRALIDAGGDIRVGRAPPASAGWKVELLPGGNDAPDRARRTILLSHAAVATSGDAFRFVEIDGKHYSHIVDPHTGLGLTTRLGVSVVAPDGLTADVLATSVSVLGVEKGFEIIEKTPGAAALVRQQMPDGSLKTHFSGRTRDWKWAEKSDAGKLQ